MRKPVEGTMAANTLLISAGDVIEVQLTSETVIMQTPEGRRTENSTPGHITNRMRLFVRETDGSEKKYDFEDTELGVRETQRVAIVRGRLKKIAEPVHLLLFNLSSGEHDEFESGLAPYLAHKPFFGPLWKAGALSFGVAFVFWCASHFVYDRSATSAAWLGLMFGFLFYPVFWWISATWDRVTERMRYRSARKRFIKEMTGRVRAHAPTAPAAPQTSPEPSPTAGSAAPEPSAG
jgi:hypothetical protein